MKPSLSITIITMSAMLSTGFLSAAAEAASLGLFEANVDVGAPKLAGSASYDPAKNEYTLSGGGSNMWTTSDQFQFL